MMRILTLLAGIFICVFLLPLSSSQITIGVSPSFLDLKEINPGYSKIARFYVVTPSNDVFLAYLKSSPGDSNIFQRGNYKDLIYNYSEEDISSWVEFISNPVEFKKIEGKKTIKAANEVTFILKVPKNAEPGYHTGLIEFKPVGLEQPGMINIRSLVRLNFLFKVPGRAVRNGKVLEISSSNYYDGKLALNVFFQNTGTVTIKPKSVTIKIFNKKNECIATLHSNTDFVKPGKIKKFTAFLPVNDIKEGNYNASAEVDFLTGKAFKQSVVQVYKPIIPIPKVVEKKITISPWIIIVGVVVVSIIAYFIYRGE